MVLQRNLRDAVANSCLISTISYYNLLEQYSCVENFYVPPATKLLLAKKDTCGLRFDKNLCQRYKYIIKLIVLFLYEIDIIPCFLKCLSIYFVSLSDI